MLITFFRPESAGCLHLFRHKALANIAICSSFSEVAIFCASDYSEQSREHSMFSWSNLNLNTVKPVLSGHRIKRVSMGLTDRRKTAKNLADSRKN